MSNDDFWYQPKRPRREVVAEQMSRLTFVETTEAPPAPSVPEMSDEEWIAFHQRQYQLFWADFVHVIGGPYPITKTLAKQLGYEVENLPPARSYEAGDDAAARGY